MNAKKFLIAWHIFAFIYLVVFVSLMGLFPELQTFSYLTKKHGFIDIENWDSYYLLFIALTALIINNALVALVFKLLRKNK